MKTSIASRLLAAIGLMSATYSQSSAPAFRGPTRAKRSVKKTRYVQGLQNHFALQQRNRMQAKKMHPLRDEHGAFTLVGNEKRDGLRKWLGGISAQRGY